MKHDVRLLGSIVNGTADTHDEVRTFRPRSGRGRRSLLLLPRSPFLAILVICIGSVVLVVFLVVVSMVFVALKDDMGQERQGRMITTYRVFRVLGVRQD
jgi:hypothetical protein